jgi:BirA family biotin operon repressor/biotin-[acetyl-CoA-carboxylase] ligase
MAVTRPDDDIGGSAPVGWTRAITLARSAGRLPSGGDQDAVVHQVLAIGPVDSTQDEAAALVTAGVRTGTLVVTDRQRQGRGRQGKDWEDDPRPGASLAATLVLDAPAVGLQLVPHALGLATQETIAGLVPTEVIVALKWPNDVVHVERDGSLAKLAGILVERRTLAGRDVLLCGLGINVDRRQQPRSAARTGIADLRAAAVDPEPLLVALVAALDRALALLGTDPARLLARYRAACCTVGCSVEISATGRPPLRARAIDVDAQGRLVVEADGRSVAVLSGTVRHLGPSRGHGHGSESGSA